MMVMQRLLITVVLAIVGAAMLAGCGIIPAPDHITERTCQGATSCVLVYSGGELIGSFADTAWQVLGPGLIGVRDAQGAQVIISGDFVAIARDGGAGR